MKKRFIVLAESTKKSQNEDFIKWVKEERLAWWHWIQNSWLLVDSKGSFSVREIRDKAHEIFSDSNVLVVQINEGEATWSGFGPNSDNKNMFGWLKKTWGKAKNSSV